MKYVVRVVALVLVIWLAFLLGLDFWSMQYAEEESGLFFTGEGEGYLLLESDELRQALGQETEVPDSFTSEECCVLHPILLLIALGVIVYAVVDREKRQERILEMRRAME